MASRELSRELLHTAKSDLKALTHMEDAVAFDDRIFGFHAQQAVEKTLKAWLNIIGRQHPHTHDLSLLLGELSKEKVDVKSYWDFLELNSYAVQFRYETPTEEAPLVRIFHKRVKLSVRSYCAGCACEICSRHASATVCLGYFMNK